MWLMDYLSRFCIELLSKRYKTAMLDLPYAWDRFAFVLVGRLARHEFIEDIWVALKACLTLPRYPTSRSLVKPLTHPLGKGNLGGLLVRPFF